MAAVYCEFCGSVASTKVRDPIRPIDWTHDSAQDVARCRRHQRTSKRHDSARTFDPLTGQHRRRWAGYRWPQEGEGQ